MTCSRASEGQIKEFINVYSRYKTIFLRLLFISENHISNQKIKKKGVEKEGNGNFYKFWASKEGHMFLLISKD